MITVGRNFSLLFFSLGPLPAGSLLGALPARAAVGLLSGCAAALAIAGTLTPAIRTVALPARR